MRGAGPAGGVGNVSLYNEHMGNPIYPTPVVGVVGLLDDASLAVGAGFRNEGDHVYLAGGGTAAVDGSEYQKLVLGTVEGRIPEPDLENERKLHELLAAAAEARLLSSAHDVSDGGLAVCLAESAIAGAIGVTAEADELFWEGEGRAVISARSRARGGGNRAGRRPSDSASGYGRWRPDLDRSGTIECERRRRLHSSAIPDAMGDPE